MKLLTYNFLTSKSIRGVKVGYPLKISVSEKKIKTTDFNQEFMNRIIPRLDWSAVKLGAQIVGCASDLPEELPEHYSTDNEFLQKLHHVLLEIDIIEGNLECPETGRKFPIADGIPNMLLNEDEV